MGGPKAGSSTEGAPRARVLLLCRSPAWRAAVEREAGPAGGMPGVVQAASAQEAMQHLAGEPDYFSHLLLEPEAAGPLLADLLSLSSAEAGPGPALVLLGTAPEPQAACPATLVPTPEEPGWLARALRPWRRQQDPSAPAAPRTGGLAGAAELRRALADGRAHVLYQPVVRMEDRRPCGIEALARLEHPVWGRLAPEHFLPGIEAAGLVGELTRAVVRQCLQDWSGEHLEELDLSLAINLPLDILMQPSAPPWLAARLAEAGLPASRVVLELTETQPVHDVAALGETVHRLRAHGFRLAIDDVGPASRDPQALLALPFTSLKLDKAVVREAADSAEARAYLRQTVEAAHAEGMLVVAEGVEDAEIWARMQSLGVDCAQGYGIARPLPAVAVPLWHHAWQADVAMQRNPRRAR